jgi:hypothetical protein
MHSVPEISDLGDAVQFVGSRSTVRDFVRTLPLRSDYSPFMKACEKRNRYRSRFFAIVWGCMFDIPS